VFLSPGTVRSRCLRCLRRFRRFRRPGGVAGAFEAVPGYLDAAGLGLPTRGTAEALRAAVDDWQAGRAAPSTYDEAVERCRAAYARLVGAAQGSVAVGSQVSALVGLVAVNLPEGAEVLTVHGEFTSVLFPLLVRAGQPGRSVRVRQVPADRLLQEVRPGTGPVTFSLVQSSDGRVLPGERIAEAARSVGALTLCDTSQAVGWLPVRAEEYDVTVCTA
jgi:selenocysteine lyase/cysteine desulfurase